MRRDDRGTARSAPCERAGGRAPHATRRAAPSKSSSSVQDPSRAVAAERGFVAPLLVLAFGSSALRCRAAPIGSPTQDDHATRVDRTSVDVELVTRFELAVERLDARVTARLQLVLAGVHRGAALAHGADDVATFHAHPHTRR